MATLIVGIGDCKVTSNAEDVLVTHALGSCIAVIIHDPVAKVAGLLHYMLPASSLDPARAAARPYVFADTGIPLLFHLAYCLGAAKSRMKIFAAGGARMLESNGDFHIGMRNHIAMRRIFLQAGVQVRGEDIGGTNSRAVSLEVQTGRVLVRTCADER